MEHHIRVEFSQTQKCVDVDASEKRKIKIYTGKNNAIKKFIPVPYAQSECFVRDCEAENFYCQIMYL